MFKYLKLFFEKGHAMDQKKGGQDSQYRPVQDNEGQESPYIFSQDDIEGEPPVYPAKTNGSEGSLNNLLEDIDERTNHEFFPMEIESQQATMSRKFYSPFFDLCTKAHANPRLWSARFGCYIWYALNILLLACVLFFPVLPHTSFDLSAREQRDFLKASLKLMELLTPGCTDDLSAMIPKDWKSSLTHYDFYFKGVCVEDEGHERFCQSGQGEKLIHGIIRHMGNQMAEYTEDSDFPSDWLYEFDASVRAAKFDIPSGNFTESTRLTEKAYSEMTSSVTFERVFAILSLLLCALGLFLEHITILFPVSEKSCYEPRVMTMVYLWIFNVLLLIFESARYHDSPQESLNFKLAHGHYITVVIWCVAWQIIYYIALVSYYAEQLKLEVERREDSSSA